MLHLSEGVGGCLTARQLPDFNCSACFKHGIAGEKTLGLVQTFGATLDVAAKLGADFAGRPGLLHADPVSDRAAALEATAGLEP